MRISPLQIEGAFCLELQEARDGRGSFARQFCHHELAAWGIDFEIKQCNVSRNIHAGTLRGMHYQKEPYPEIKVVSCWTGRVYDVMVDIRPTSPTYLKWIALELSGDNGKMLYIPAGVAHGYQTLEDNTTVYYQLGEFFQPQYYAGVRWDDPKFGISWPDCPQRLINERDANYPLL